VDRDPSYRQGQQFGAWTLVRYVDSGGNGEVWVAEDSSGHTVAIKILYRFGGDGYPRFVREIEIVRGLDTDRLAVLPILDADVPEKPSKSDPPWFVMPLATGMTTALSGRRVIEKVEAVRQIAATLALLVEEESLNHRDLKPGNLYNYRGRFVVGDFGLAKRPDDEDLTETDRVVGPYAYLPSEVFVGDGDLDWELVDVNVLARTLWQLIADTNRPVRGPIAAGGEYSLARYTDDEYVALLDGIIASATHETPSQRPTLAAFEDALADWLLGTTTRSELAREIERLDANTTAVLRWLISWVRSEPGFNSFQFALENPEAPTDISGLNERDVVEALGELVDQYAATGNAQGRHRETGLPLYWTRLYPTRLGIERVEDPEILLAQGAPLLRALLVAPDLLQLTRHPAGVSIGGLTLPAAEAFFLLRYMRDRGLVSFEDQPGGGGGVLLMNIKVTREGKVWLAMYQPNG
jgi:serine/threonine protein kinase